jgi:hypothetical protein
VIASILRELFHGIVIGKNIAMDATQQRYGNFQDGNKKMVCRFTNRAFTHSLRNLSTGILEARAIIGGL